MLTGRPVKAVRPFSMRYRGERPNAAFPIWGRPPSRLHKVSFDLPQVEIADHPVVLLTDVRP